MNGNPIYEEMLNLLKIPIQQHIPKLINNCLIIDVYSLYRHEIQDSINAILMQNIFNDALKIRDSAHIASEMLLKIFEVMPNIKEYCESELEKWYTLAKDNIISNFPTLEPFLEVESPFNIEQYLSCKIVKKIWKL